VVTPLLIEMLLVTVHGFKEILLKPIRGNNSQLSTNEDFLQTHHNLIIIVLSKIMIMIMK